MRHLVIRRRNGGKVGSSSQDYESSISDEIFETISEGLKVKGTKCGVNNLRWPCQYEILEKSVENIEQIKS